MKEYNRRILADNIKLLRKQKNLNQAELGKLLHVSQQTVGSWETGRAIPGSDTLNILADYFQVTTDELLGRDTQSSTISDHDLEDMLDNAHSYDGKPMDDHDRALIKQYLEALFSQRDTNK